MVKISIITPTYKGAKYIAQTIASVQMQDFWDYEHIIIDDNSPDKSEEIIKIEQKKDKKIIYIKNTINLGIAKSRNKGVEIATWEYICFLDHDDTFISSHKLTKQKDFLDTHKEYGIVSSLIVTIDSLWNILSKNHGRETDKDIRTHFLQSNQFLPCAMMIRKNAIVEYGWFDSHYDKSDDYDLWMKIGRTWKMYCLQEYMTWYRIHENNTSKKTSTLYFMRRLAFKIFRKNRNYYPNFLKALFYRIGEWLLPPFIVEKIIYLIKKTP